MVVGMPGAESSPAALGSAAGGFRVSGAGSAALRIQVWGYWGAEIAGEFSKKVAGMAQSLMLATALTFDASDLKPQGAEGQEALRVLFRALASTTLAGGEAVVAKNVLTRMQLTRLLRECGIEGRWTF
jgi:hypothetical protein